MMPQLSGFAACEKIKANPETYLIPVILITALSGRQDRLEGIKAGADDFLTRPVDRTELLARVRSLLRLKLRTDELERAESVLFTLARSIEGKDPYTHGDCKRLSDYSARLAQHLGLADDQVTALRRAGVVHDIGKIAVPDAILLKPGRLTEEEWKLIREHPVVGERICAPLKSFRSVLPIIRHHHEKFSGLRRVDLSGPAKQRDIRGDVGVDVLVGPDGAVICTAGYLGHPMVLKDVEEAVRQWKFKSLKENNKPVAFVGNLHFALCNIGCTEAGRPMTLLAQ